MLGFIKVKVLEKQLNSSLDKSIFCGQIVFVPLEKVLDKRNVNDIEIGSCIKCSLKNGRRFETFVCELLFNDIFKNDESSADVQLRDNRNDKRKARI